MLLRCTTLATVALACLTSSSYSQAEPHVCSIIENDAARLNCFDVTFPNSDRAELEPSSSEAPPPPTSPPNLGAWQVRESKNTMTDDPRVTAIVYSSSPVPGRYRDNDFAQLTIRCDENTTSLYIFFGGAFMSSSEYHSFGDVRYRIDDGPAKTKSFDESTDNHHLGLWNGGTSIPVIKSMFGGKILKVEASPYNESRFTLQFYIDGIEDAVAPIRKTCGW